MAGQTRSPHFLEDGRSDHRIHGILGALMIHTYGSCCGRQVAVFFTAFKEIVRGEKLSVQGMFIAYSV